MAANGIPARVSPQRRRGTKLCTGQLAAFSGTTAGAQRSCGSRRRSEIEQIVCLRGIRGQVRDGRTSTSDHEDWSVVRKRRLVILDACRNDPFVAHDLQCQRDSINWSRDWSFEPEGGVLVAYAAKHGTTAEESIGTNSRFAEARADGRPNFARLYLLRWVKRSTMAAHRCVGV